MKRIELFQFLATEELAPGVLSSSQLVSLALNAKSGLSPASWVQNILGEILFRVMAYRGNISQELQEFLDHPSVDNFSKKLENLGGGKSDEKIFSLKPIPEEGQFARSCIYFNKRLNQIKDADGLFPLLHKDHYEAIVMPFSFRKNLFGEENGFFEGGKKPRRLKFWQGELAPLHEFLRSDVGRICLSLPLGPFKAFGGSLVLPIYLSIKSIDDPFSPTKDKYLATGTFDQNGILQDVDGLEEKRLLAEQMGLGFVGPKIKEDTGGLTYKSGSEQNYVFFEKWKKELGTDISSVTPNDAYRVLRDYESKMLRRVVTSEQAILTVGKILEVLESTEQNEYIVWQAYVCLGNAYNHIGDSDKASFYLNQAVDNLGEHDTSHHLITALCSIAVSKADEGFLALSREYGINAHDMSNGFHLVEPRVQNRLLLQSKGALAGQSLTQYGIWEDQQRIDSKKYLEEAVSIADGLIKMASNPYEKEEAINDWAHSHGQLAWWYALHEPRAFISNFVQWQNELLSYGRKVFESQSAYLIRGRWHAAFRLALNNEMQEMNWLQWSLPQVDRPNEIWLKGLALKYRGFLNSKLNNIEASKSDFDEAVAIFQNLYFENRKSHIFEYIRGTIKVLKYIALNDAEAKTDAIEIFRQMKLKDFYTKHPKASPNEWLNWLQNSDLNSKVVFSPQNFFVY